jgi:hypothetical protein
VIELPDYPLDGDTEYLICTRPQCGKRAVVEVRDHVE